jgi:hypothetical protein
MAKNLGREFATMSDDERRQFALEQGETEEGAAREDAADELEINDPRPDKPGAHANKEGRKERRRSS